MNQAQKNEESTMVISEQCGIPQVLQAEFNATTCNYLTEFCNHTRASTHQSSVKLIILLRNQQTLIS